MPIKTGRERDPILVLLRSCVWTTTTIPAAAASPVTEKQQQAAVRCYNVAVMWCGCVLCAENVCSGNNDDGESVTDCV